MPDRLCTDDALAAALAAPRYLLFKHSTTCPISAAAFAQYRRFAEAHPDVATGWIDVIDDRPLARAVAERTGVRHESPQALLLDGGEVRWDASHGAITVASLEQALS
jgi:bacillithiol system protein YtxJ